MKKEWSVLFLFLLVISFTSAYSHLGNNVFIKVNGVDNGLQSAINANNFKTDYAGGVSSSSIIFGHNANEIIANVNGTVKTFAAALSDGTLKSTLPGRSSSGYGNYNLIHGEYATNVLVSNGTAIISLQQAINDGWFYVAPICAPEGDNIFCSGNSKTCGSYTNLDNCGVSRTVNCGTCTSGYTCSSNNCVVITTYSWSTGTFGTCSLTCGGGTQTRTVQCKDNSGNVVSESFCTTSKPSTSQACNTQACSATMSGSTSFDYISCTKSLRGTTYPFYYFTCSISATARCGTSISCSNIRCVSPAQNTVNSVYCSAAGSDGTSCSRSTSGSQCCLCPI